MKGGIISSTSTMKLAASRMASRAAMLRLREA
jgi:hypothetical protein